MLFYWENGNLSEYKNTKIPINKWFFLVSKKDNQEVQHVKINKFTNSNRETYFLILKRKTKKFKI